MSRLAAVVLVALSALAQVGPGAVASAEPAAVSAAVDEAPAAAPAAPVSARIGVAVGVAAPLPAPRPEQVAPEGTTFEPDLRLLARRVRPSAFVPRLGDPDPH